jgi:hypothetical protein
LSKNLEVDKFLTSYFEQTQQTEGVKIDMDMFKKIAFSSGMPLIVIDLMIYLCGSYKNVSVSKNCQRAIGMLEERAPPIYLSKGKSSMSNRCS